MSIDFGSSPPEPLEIINDAKWVIVEVLNQNEDLPQKGFIGPVPGEFIPPYHGGSDPKKIFATIQLAINDAVTGEIIRIPDGQYFGNVDDDKGVTFSPGTSPGCVTITGNFTVTPTTTFDMDIRGEDVCDDYDQINVTGDLDITDASLNIILDGYTPAPGSEFVIFIYGGTLSGTFDDITVDNPDVEFAISYGGGTDDEIVLTASGDPPAIPLANWALYLGFILVFVVVAIRFRGSIF